MSIDELEVVRSMRMKVGAFDAGVDERIRARIAQASQDTIRRDLVDLDDEPVVTLEPIALKIPSRSDDTAAVIDLRAAPRPPAPRRQGLVAVAAVALTVLVVGGLFAYRGGERPTGESDLATDSSIQPVTLEDLAEIARVREDTSLADEQYEYTDVQRSELSTLAGEIRRSERRVQTTANAQNAGRTVHGSQKLFALDHPDAPAQNGDSGRSFDQPSVDSRPFFAGTTAGYTYEQIRSLPSAADEMRSAIVRELGANEVDGSQISIATIDLLAHAVISPDAQYALIVLLRDQGFVGVGNRTDANGRTGPAFEATFDGARLIVIFDASDARPFEYQQLVVKPGVSDAPQAVQGVRLRSAAYGKPTYRITK